MLESNVWIGRQRLVRFYAQFSKHYLPAKTSTGSAWSTCTGSSEVTTQKGPKSARLFKKAQVRMNTFATTNSSSTIPKAIIKFFILVIFEIKEENFNFNFQKDGITI